MVNVGLWGFVYFERLAMKNFSKLAPDEKIDWVKSSFFLLSHLVPLLAIFTGVHWKDWVLCAALFWIRMFFITGAYHRYFSHRSYKVGRVTQFLLAFGAETSSQKGVLWWAANHRHHHRYSDQYQDVHSPKRGFWWSHMGWILCKKYHDADYTQIPDFAKYPELRFLDRYWALPPTMLALATFVWGGWSALLIGFFLSTVLLWHSTFFINSLAHVFGRRRYATTDTSRNSLMLACLTMGEGWHNNHHHFQASANQGFYWYEIDVTYYILRAMSWVGLASDLKKPSAAVLKRNRVKDGCWDIGILGEIPSRAAGVLSASAQKAKGMLVDAAQHASDSLQEPASHSL